MCDHFNEKSFFLHLFFIEPQFLDVGASLAADSGWNAELLII